MPSEENGFVRQNAANFLTLLNVVFGSLSIILSINGRFRWSIALIGLASVADRYDGVVARRLGTTSEIGVQLDSLGDSISFGVAPALLIYMRLVQPLLPGIPKLLLTFCVLVYIVCGIFRLARYNVHGLSEGAFEGVPITLAGMILALLMLMAQELSVYVYGFLLLFFAFMMVSKFKLKKR